MKDGIKVAQEDRRRLGFTLAEMLTVISIISILAIISIYGVNKLRDRERDTRRKTDLVGMRNSMESFYQIYKVYPYPSGINGGVGTEFASVTGCTTITGYASVAVCLKAAGYAGEPINDPKYNDGRKYRYGIAEYKTNYEFSAQLENINDAKQKGDCTTGLCDPTRYEIGTAVGKVNTSGTQYCPIDDQAVIPTAGVCSNPLTGSPYATE